MAEEIMFVRKIDEIFVLNALKLETATGADFQLRDSSVEAKPERMLT